MIQIKGNSKFNITLDATTWIFDDRKVKIEDLEKGIFNGERPIEFENNVAWNRAILEGATMPPTLNSETTYKKRSFLEETFVINAMPFIKNSEPNDDATKVILKNDNDSIEIPIEDWPYLFFHFSKEGKMIYKDGKIDAFVYDQENGYRSKFSYVAEIEVV
nr:hypothetical protein [Mammaliicoccus sp. Marseille-Q6498]